MAEGWRRGYVKICGVTTCENARSVIDAGADAIGINLGRSVRHVARERAAEILEATSGAALRTLVFFENSDDEILKLWHELDAEVAQLHDPISESLLSGLRERPGRLVKALRIDSSEFESFDEGGVDAVLVDGPRPGSGLEHSWTRLSTRSFRVPVIAAGGLTPRNVKSVIHETRAWGVDCASGVESAPGVKSPELVRDFIAGARGAWNVESVT